MHSKIKTGDVYTLFESDRKYLVESVVTIGNICLIVLYPISYAIWMACDSDFIILKEASFNFEPVIAETWNKLAVPGNCLQTYIGSLSEEYLKYFSSFIYYTYQSIKHSTLSIITGPPIKTQDDIRNLFQSDEKESIKTLRSKLVNI